MNYDCKELSYFSNEFENNYSPLSYPWIPVKIQDLHETGNFFLLNKLYQNFLKLFSSDFNFFQSKVFPLLGLVHTIISEN